jgi:hypothetical protein
MRNLGAVRDFALRSGDTPDLIIPIRNTNDEPAAFVAPRLIWILSTKPEPVAADVLVVKDTADGSARISIVDGVWTAVAPLLIADTDHLTPGRYFHAARVLDGPLSFTVLTGVAKIEGSIPIPA